MRKRTKYLLIWSVVPLLSFAFLSPVDLKEFNGWEFLEWSSSKEKVETVLKEKGYEYDPGMINQKQGPTTTFIYEDMETRLAFDEGTLYDVQQSKYFSLSEENEAAVFYESITQKLNEKYGQPEFEVKEDGKDRRKWKLKFTRISFFYHKNKESENRIDDQAFVFYIQANKL